MPPVPIYTSSPINAAKASGANPKTSPPASGGPSVAGPHAPGVTPATTTAESQGGSRTSSYPPPQPGAVPSATGPTPTTRTSRAYAPSPYEPTGSDRGAYPPPPQPGAVPTAPAMTSSLPPPPKAGQAASMDAQHPPVTAAPPQISMPPPMMPHTQGISTSTAYPPPPQAGARPAMLPTGATQDLSHPPGYQQAPGGAAPSMREWSGESGGGYDDDGVWDAAKKWAKDAGDKVAAAESEVWRRINQS